MDREKKVYQLLAGKGSVQAEKTQHPPSFPMKIVMFFGIEIFLRLPLEGTGQLS